MLSSTTWGLLAGAVFLACHLRASSAQGGDDTAAAAERSDAKEKLDDQKRATDIWQARMVKLTAYEANLTSSVANLESEIKDMEQEKSTLEARLENLKSGGSALDALRSSAKSEVAGLVRMLTGLQRRVQSLRGEQVSLLTKSLDRGGQARELADEQREIEADIRLYVRRVSSLRTAAERDNATLTETDAALERVHEDIEAVHQQSAQETAGIVREKRIVGEAVSRLNADKQAVDEVSARTRAANVELVRAVDEIIKRRDAIQAKRDSLRRNVILLNVIVRQLGESVAAAKAELSDVKREGLRTAGLHEERAKENAVLETYGKSLAIESEQLHAKTAALEASLPELSERLANMSSLRDEFAAQLAAVRANVTADEEIVQNLRAARTALRARLLDTRGRVGDAKRKLKRLASSLRIAGAVRDDVKGELEEAETGVRKLLARIGDVQAGLAHAEEKARAAWLERRGECQCDSLKWSGGSAREVAKCMRNCADAVVVASAALLEMSSSTTTTSSGSSSSSGTSGGDPASALQHRTAIAAAAMHGGATLLESALHGAAVATEAAGRVLPAARALARFAAADLAADMAAAEAAEAAQASTASFSLSAHEPFALFDANVADAVASHAAWAAADSARRSAIAELSAASEAESAAAAALAAAGVTGMGAAASGRVAAQRRGGSASLYRFASTELRAAAGVRHNRQTLAGSGAGTGAGAADANADADVAAADAVRHATAVTAAEARLAALQGSLHAAEARIEAILAREDSPLPMAVERIAGEVAGQLRGADTEAAVAEALRGVGQRSRLAAAASLPRFARVASSVEAAGSGSGGGAGAADADASVDAELVASSSAEAAAAAGVRLFLYGQGSAGGSATAVHGSGSGHRALDAAVAAARADPIAAVTLAQVADLAAKAKLLEKDAAAKTAACGELEAKASALGADKFRLQQAITGLKRKVDEATTALFAKGGGVAGAVVNAAAAGSGAAASPAAVAAGASPSPAADPATAATAAAPGQAGESAASSAATSDPELISLQQRRDLLQTSVATMQAQAAEAADRVSLMRAAASAADEQFTRLKRDVERLRGARESLVSQQADLDREGNSIKKSLEASQRGVASGADDIDRARDVAARDKRRLEEQLAELQREATALDSVSCDGVVPIPLCSAALSFPCSNFQPAAVTSAPALPPLCPSDPPPAFPSALQYYKFMVEANAQLEAHVAALRDAKNELISSEDAVNAEIKRSDAQLRDLTSEQSKQSAAAAKTARSIARGRALLAQITAALAAEDARRSALSEGSADAALARDKLRADQVRLQEQVDALHRQLMSTLRRAKDTNSTVRNALQQPVAGSCSLSVLRCVC